MKDELNQYKRARIIEVASRLFYERGFVGTTLDAIAQALEVNKPFIYQFFKSKHEILGAVVELEIKRTIDLLDHSCQLETSATAQLYRFVDAWVRQNIEFRMIALIFWQEQHHFLPDTRKQNRSLIQVLNRRLAELIESGISSGEFNIDNPRLAAFALTGLAQWIPRWYRADGEFEVDEIAAYFAAQALRIAGATKQDATLSMASTTQNA